MHVRNARVLTASGTILIPEDIEILFKKTTSKPSNKLTNKNPQKNPQKSKYPFKFFWQSHSKTRHSKISWSWSEDNPLMQWVSALPLTPGGQTVQGKQITKDKLTGDPSPWAFMVSTDPSSYGRSMQVTAGKKSQQNCSLPKPCLSCGYRREWNHLVYLSNNL